MSAAVDVAPASANLALQQQDQYQQKRKRDAVESTINGEISHTFVQSKLRDVHAALKSYDPSPSILDFQIAGPSTNGADETPEPPSKRAKHDSTEDSPPNTITVKVQNNAYTSVAAFIADIETSSHALIGNIKSETDHGPYDTWHQTQNAYDRSLLIAQASEFCRIARSILRREFPAIHIDQAIKDEEQDEAEGGMLASDSQEGKTVLTLFGSAGGQKQLFSSFQRGLPKSLWKSSDKATSSQIASTHEAHFHLRDDSLPNGITTTKILPTSYDMNNDDKENKKVSTFADKFTPKLLPQYMEFEKPRPPNATSSRSARKSNNGFTTDQIPTGSWLGYSGVISQTMTTPATAKRKQRNQSTSLAEVPIVTEESQQQAKEDALYRSAYSSFAPCKDDGAGVVPVSVRSQVWWDYAGQDAFSRELYGDKSTDDSEDTAMNEKTETEEGSPDLSPEDEDAAFKEAVEAYNPRQFTYTDPESSDEKDTEQILQDISEMLQTLYSYQRIRNSTTASATSAVSASDFLGTPTNPSSSELSLFQTLQMQLALMVSMLPPYAVARLNGDQLAELNISRHIDMTIPTSSGIMSEDQATRLAAQEAAARASAAATSTPTTRTYPSARTNQPARTGYPGYYASSGRPPPRTPLSSWQTPAQQQASSNRAVSSSTTYGNAQPGTTYGTGGTMPRPGSAANLSNHRAGVNGVRSGGYAGGGVVNGQNGYGASPAGMYGQSRTSMSQGSGMTPNNATPSALGARSNIAAGPGASAGGGSGSARTNSRG